MAEKKESRKERGSGERKHPKPPPFDPDPRIITERERAPKRDRSGKLGKS